MGACTSRSTTTDTLTTNNASNNELYNTKYSTTTHTTPNNNVKHLPTIHTDIINDITHSRKLNCILTASHDTTCILYDIQSLQYKCKLVDHTNAINRICIDKQDRCIYTAARDKTIRQYNLYTYNAPTHNTDTLPVQHSTMCYSGHTMNVTGLSVNPITHNTIVSGARNYNIFIHDITRTEPIQQFTRIDQNVVTAVKYVPNNADCIVQTSEDLQLRIYDIRSNSIVWSLQHSNNIALNCIVSNDGNTIVTSHNAFDSNGCELNSYDIRTNKHMNTYTGHSEAVSGLCYINEQYICSSSKDSTVKIWDISTSDIDTACVSSITLEQAIGVQCVTGYMTDTNVLSITAGTVSGRIASYEYDINHSTTQLQYDSAVAG